MSEHVCEVAPLAIVWPYLWVLSFERTSSKMLSVVLLFPRGLSSCVLIEESVQLRQV